MTVAFAVGDVAVEERVERLVDGERPVVDRGTGGLGGEQPGEPGAGLGLVLADDLAAAASDGDGAHPAAPFLVVVDGAFSAWSPLRHLPCTPVGGSIGGSNRWTTIDTP